MLSNRRMINLLLAAASIASIGCGGQQEAGRDSADSEAGRSSELNGEITLVGSTTVQPLAELLAGAYEGLQPGVLVNVQGGGSSVGVTSAGRGTADIGMASRDIDAGEMEEFPDLVVHTIARDGIAIIAGPDVTVGNLALEQVRGIFAGTIVSWGQVGGPDVPIVVVSREEGSGTRGAFEEMVMGEDAVISAAAILLPSSGAILTTAASTPGSIAYLSFGYIDESVNTISIGGVAPTAENAADGTYPVVRPLNMVTKGEPGPIARSFLDFVYSADGQAIAVAEGYLPVR